MNTVNQPKTSPPPKPKTQDLLTWVKHILSPTPILINNYEDLSIPLVLCVESVDGYRTPAVLIDNEDRVIMRSHKELCVGSVPAHLISRSRILLVNSNNSLLYSELQLTIQKNAKTKGFLLGFNFPQKNFKESIQNWMDSLHRDSIHSYLMLKEDQILPVCLRSSSYSYHRLDFDRIIYPSIDAIQNVSSLRYILRKISMENCPAFGTTLHQFSEEDALTFTSWIGALFDVNSNRAKSLWISGVGFDGKSAFAEFLSHFVFKGASVALSGSKRAQFDPYFTSTLVGKRLGVFDDTAPATFLDTEFFLNLTGSSVHRVERKFDNSKTSIISTMFLFLSNKKPKFTDKIAKLRRVLHVEMAPINVFVPNHTIQLQKELPELISLCIQVHEKMLLLTKIKDASEILNPSRIDEFGVSFDSVRRKSHSNYIEELQESDPGLFEILAESFNITKDVNNCLTYVQIFEKVDPLNKMSSFQRKSITKYLLAKGVIESQLEDGNKYLGILLKKKDTAREF